MTSPFVCRVATTPGWNNEIKSIHTDYCFDDKKGWHVGITVMMRVILVDGTFHEDLGFGAVANARSRGDALMQAKKVRVCVSVPWPLGRRQATARGGGCATEAPRRQKQLFSTSRPGAASPTPSSPLFLCSFVPGTSPVVPYYRQSAVTDALKRTMRLFGDGLGNCVSKTKKRAVEEKSKAIKGRDASAADGKAAPTTALRS